jgi:hypothetical protein
MLSIIFSCTEEGILKSLKFIFSIILKSLKVSLLLKYTINLFCQVLRILSTPCAHLPLKAHTIQGYVYN